ncbi:hypothetical protein LJR153_007327 [Paenibacillus sp. LjRoot153]|uniref:transcription termination/antitermination NusG family protein n=1 Tax=Paenibacillus sp. LjRoot153 TaxID=3342270 RepID=UPI003ED05C46
MSAIFAIQVEVGKEITVKQLLMGVLQRNHCNEVQSVYACEQVVSRRGKSHLVGEVSGYIFVQLVNGLSELSANLWHLIKGMPKVYQILKHAIPETEFFTFYEGLTATQVVQISEQTTEELAAGTCVSHEELVAAINKINTKARKSGKRLWDAIGAYTKKTALYLRLPTNMLEYYKDKREPLEQVLFVLHEMEWGLLDKGSGALQ